MNWVKANRKTLENDNYVLKADVSSNYWFGLSFKKIELYRLNTSSEFNIIIFGDEDSEADYYTIPYNVIKDLLTEDNLYYQGKRLRWVGDIKNNILKIRNSNIDRNVGEYYTIPLSFTSKESTSKATFADDKNDYSIENGKREIAIRLKQSKFRKDILKNFSNKCCLTGATETELLVASHIIPWCDKIETRLDPKNGLLLSIHYDKLFDKGYFTFDESLVVQLTPRIEKLSASTKSYLVAIENTKICPTGDFGISIEALKYHKENVFDKFKI